MCSAARSVTAADAVSCSGLAAPSSNQARSSSPTSVPGSAVNDPSSSSVSATSYPVEHRGPVPIDTQKQVSPGVEQFTPIVIERSRRSRYAGSATMKTRSWISIACRSHDRRPTNA